MLKKGKFVFLAIFLIIVIAALWFFGSLFAVLGPKDLGVKYTEADYKSAITKTGMSISFEGKTGDEINAHIKSLGNKKLDINDYNWSFTNYQPKSFKLTPAEATAFLNEIAPAFWWFDDLQVNVLPDGTMQGSSTADIAKLKKDLYSDIANKIPIPIPNKVNLYGEGKISITNNKLTADPKKMELGPISLPDKYMTGSNVAIASTYLERIYTIIPEFKINSLKADEQNNFVFDGVIPQNVTVTKK